MRPPTPDHFLNDEQLVLVDQAVSISEDVISNRFHLTASCWRRNPYDIRTLQELSPGETHEEAFAQILKYGRPRPPDGLRTSDFYRICLQDHNILRAIKREPDLKLLPLMVYIVTHELVHLVRFGKFFQFFEADLDQRAAEEVRVHQLTFEALRPVKIPHLPRIFDYYQSHRSPIPLRRPLGGHGAGTDGNPSLLGLTSP